MATLPKTAEEMMCSSMAASSFNPHLKIVDQQPKQKECGIMDKQTMKLSMTGSLSSPRRKSFLTAELMSMPVADPNRPHAPPSSMPSTASFPSSKTLPSPSSLQHLFQLKHSPSARLIPKSLEMAQMPPPSPPVTFTNYQTHIRSHHNQHHHFHRHPHQYQHLLHQIHLPRLPSSNRPRAPLQSLPSPSPTTPQIKSPPSSSTSPITPLPSTSTQPPSPEQPHLHHQSQPPSSSSLLAPSPSTTQQSPVSPSTAKASSTSPPSQLPSPSTPPTSPTSPPLPPPPAVSSPLPPPLTSPFPHKLHHDQHQLSSKTPTDCLQ